MSKSWLNQDSTKVHTFRAALGSMLAVEGQGSAARFRRGGKEDSERSQEHGDPGQSGSAELLSWACFSLTYLLGYAKS